MNYEQSAEARLTMLGRVAANKLAPPLDYPTPYAMFDIFDETDELPEIYDNGLKIVRRICDNYPQFADCAITLMREYERRRADFEPIYRALPQASFQADMNKTNLLFDGEKFVGLMDFNLSGTDTVLAYAFYECHYYMTEAEIRNTILTRSTTVIDNRTLRNFGYVGREYNFSDKEKDAFSEFYRLAVPFWGSNCHTYHELISESGKMYVPKIRDFIEQILNAADVTMIEGK
jgi:hypothetical protein